MDWEIREVAWSSVAYQETLQLRNKVLREPLGLVQSAEEVAGENGDLHLAVYGGSETALLGGLVLSATGQDGEARVRQVSVEEHVRGQGLGVALMREVELHALRRGHGRLILHAREPVVAFYLKLGWEISGPSFEEIGLPHLPMHKEMAESAPQTV